MLSILICTLSLFCIYGILLLFYRKGWQELKTSTPETFSVLGTTKISILIPARNEAQNIAACLNAILQNDYPEQLREVIVIDDFSTDDTFKIASELLENRNGKVLLLKELLPPDQPLNSYKKKALELAIQKASGELIITTDADCVCQPFWIKSIVALYEKSAVKFIVAPVSFTPATNKNLLYYFQSLDFMTMQGITAAGTQLNWGILCNGANLAFQKSAFDAVNGYQGINDIASGDDLLLLHKIKTKFPNQIQYLKSKSAIVETPCQPTLSDFWNQRIRWASKSGKYKDPFMTFVLLLVYLLNLSLLLLLVLAVISVLHTASYSYLLAFLGILILKTLFELLLLTPVSTFYHKKKELIWFLFLQPLHLLYIVAAGFLGIFTQYKWKERVVK